MTRSELIELLNNAKNSTLWNDILIKLEFFCYEATEKDVEMLAQCLTKVENKIKLNCNLSEVPYGTIDLEVADAVIGEFLGLKKALNQLDISSIDLGTALSSVSMGNTSVSFNPSDSDSAKLDSVITTMKSSLERIYPCLRTVKW